jgi:uncharacterized membrane protein YqiK
MANQLVTEQAALAGDGRALSRHDNKPPTAVETLTSELVEVYGAQLKSVEPIARRATDAPEKIESDNDLKAWTTIAVDASTLWKALDIARLNEQRPVTAVFKDVFGPTLDRLQRITDAARDKANVYNRAKLAREKAEREAEEKRLREEAAASQRDAQIAAEFQNTPAAIEHVQEAAAINQQIAEIAASAPKPADVARVRSEGGGMSTVNAVWKFEVADYAKVDLNAIRQFIAPDAIDKAIRKIVGIQKGATKIEGVRVYEEADTQFRR